MNRISIVTSILALSFFSQLTLADDGTFHAQRSIFFTNNRSVNITATDHDASHYQTTALPFSQHSLYYPIYYPEDILSQGGQMIRTIVVTSDVDHSTICTLTITTAYPSTHDIKSDNDACSITPHEDTPIPQGELWWKYILHQYKDEVIINPAS